MSERKRNNQSGSKVHPNKFLMVLLREKKQRRTVQPLGTERRERERETSSATFMSFLCTDSFFIVKDVPRSQVRCEVESERINIFNYFFFCI